VCAGAGPQSRLGGRLCHGNSGNGTSLSRHKIAAFSNRAWNLSHCPLRCTVAAELVTGCSLPHSTICQLPLQCRISTSVTCHATKSWCVERHTKNDLKYITLTHTTCTYWKFKLTKKLKGTNTLPVPPTQKLGGTCLPLVPVVVAPMVALLTSLPNVNFSRLSTLAVALGKPTGVLIGGVQTPPPLNLRFFKTEFAKYMPTIQALLLYSLNPKFSTEKR